MRPTVLFQCILLVLLAACTIGCKEDPASSVPGPPQPPHDLVVTQTDSVKGITADVSWHAPADSSGITGYRIWWNEMWDGPIDSIDVDETMRVATLEGLKAFRRYAISVATLRGTLRSGRTTVEWISGSHVPLLPPRHLRAATVGSTWINLAWDSPINEPGATYIVSWAGDSRGYRDSNVIAGINTTYLSVTGGIRHGVEYTFYVRAVHDERVSQPATILWAGAVNYTNDARNPGKRLRLYEQASANHSALIVDPSKGGPGGITIDAPSSNVQLGLYVVSDSTFLIGPAYAIHEFLHAASFDQDVYVSQSAYSVTGLDTWFSTMPIDQYIPSDGNLRAFMAPAVGSGFSGIGFYLRTGQVGDYHFARVFLRNVGGKILQGVSPERYVDVDLSYQVMPHLPYAKRLSGEESPVAFTSHRRR